MLEGDWFDLAHDDLTVEPCVGQDGYGEPAFSSSGAWSCRAIVQCDRRLLTFPDGRVEVSTTQIFALSSSGHIGMADRLSWSTMAPPSTEPARILNVDHSEDEDGQHHIEVLLG